MMWMGQSTYDIWVITITKGVLYSFEKTQSTVIFSYSSFASNRHF
jgi:hypothetical protein